MSSLKNLPLALLTYEINLRTGRTTEPVLPIAIEILVLCRTSMYVLLLQTIWAKKNLQKAC
jgi:hypothetical protein